MPTVNSGGRILWGSGGSSPGRVSVDLRHTPSSIS